MWVGRYGCMYLYEGLVPIRFSALRWDLFKDKLLDNILKYAIL